MAPGGTGSNDLHVWINGPGGDAMDVAEVKVAFTLKPKDIGPLPVVPAGRYTTNVMFTVIGR